MKKVMLIMAGSLLMGIAAFAQQDTTRSSTQGSQTSPTSPTVQPPTTQPYPQQGTNQYRREDMTVIQHDRLPSSLRETLGGTQYRGWENSTIYQNPTTGDYYLEMQRNNSGVPPTGGTDTRTSPTSPTTGTQNQTGNMTIYRFDRNGKAIEDNQSGGNRDDN
jgi:hypothetical protein